jgi:hypothetical protein
MRNVTRTCNSTVPRACIATYGREQCLVLYSDVSHEHAAHAVHDEHEHEHDAHDTRHGGAAGPAGPPTPAPPRTGAALKRPGREAIAGAVAGAGGATVLCGILGGAVMVVRRRRRQRKAELERAAGGGGPAAANAGGGLEKGQGAPCVG